MTKEFEENQSPDTELELLKARADKLGVTYSKNIGVETLRQRINEKLSANEDKTVAQTEIEKRANFRKELIAENLRLIRVRITNMNPSKGGQNGEFITVGNSIIGTVCKFVPYSTGDDGYHLPYIIYKNIKDRTFVRTKVIRDANGLPNIKNELIKEFAIEILPQLTKEELDKLATEQKASGRVG